MDHPKIGDIVTCAETGKPFIVQCEGAGLNYAHDAAGNIYSEEGVAIRNRRELLDRTRALSAYISDDGRHVTGWKGDVLGDIVQWMSTLRGFGDSEILCFRMKDVHGQWWSGRGAGKGRYCTLRAMKEPKS